MVAVCVRVGGRVKEAVRVTMAVRVTRIGTVPEAARIHPKPETMVIVAETVPYNASIILRIHFLPVPITSTHCRKAQLRVQGSGFRNTGIGDSGLNVEALNPGLTCAVDCASFQAFW